ncbi:MAG: hypothetical protein ACOY90_11640 [Candidatus Zhuqueibacterota bacterium]
MKSVPLKSISIQGDLLNRALKNFDRLEESRYQIPQVFRESSYSWPGDFEGRTVLALTLLSQATHRESHYLDKIISLFPKQMNKQGYFGKVRASNFVDEQQFAGQHWVVRGLIEYYLWKRDAQAYATLQNLVKNLYLPTRRFIAEYPLGPSVRKTEGMEAGNLIPGTVDNWQLSSDVGCAFLALDGLTHAYKIFLSNDLRQLTETMIQRFLEMDIAQIQAQTHAVLTALRGLLRHYEQTRDSLLLERTREIYHLYRTEAMTENYANYAWFGRPEWTEPCGMIDAFIVAVSLWRFTGEPGYLEDAHLIYFNAISHGQRANGGFGCDTCAGSTNPFIAFNNYEAHWCCTMRGGEFFARAVESLYFVDDDVIYLPFYFDNQATLQLRDDIVRIQQTTGYPYEGSVRLEILESTACSPIRLRLFLPTWLTAASLAFNGKAMPYSLQNNFVECVCELKKGDRLELHADVTCQTQSVLNRNSIRNYHTFRHGPLILGCETDEEIHFERSFDLSPLQPGVYQMKGTDIVLSPMNDVRHISESKWRAYKRQILFSF